MASFLYEELSQHEVISRLEQNTYFLPLDRHMIYNWDAKEGNSCGRKSHEITTMLLPLGPVPDQVGGGGNGEKANPAAILENATKNA